MAFGHGILIGMAIGFLLSCTLSWLYAKGFCERRHHNYNSTISDMKIPPQGF